MKAFTRIKSISKSLIYFSVFSVLISVGILLFFKNQIGADEAVPDPNEIQTSQTNSFGTRLDYPQSIHTNEEVEITYTLPQEYNGRNNSDHDRIIIKICPDNDRHTPYTNTTEACVNSEGLIRVFSRVRDYNFNDSLAEMSFIFSTEINRPHVVTIKHFTDNPETGEYDPIPGATFIQTLTIYPEDSERIDNTATIRGNITIENWPDQVINNQPFSYTIKTKDTISDYDRISVFAAKSGLGAYDSIDYKRVCTEALKGEDDCELCLKGSITRENNGTDGYSQIANYQTVLNQLGYHRFVFVAAKGEPLTIDQCNSYSNDQFENTYVDIQYDLYTKAIAANSDEDGDGIINENDNCPSVANPDQEDKDGDGVGDACEETEENGDGSNNSTIEIENPSSLKSLDDVIRRIGFLVQTFVGVLAFIALLFGGFQLMTAGDNPDQQTKAKKTIIYAVIGIILAVIIYALTISIIDILNKILSLTGSD